MGRGLRARCCPFLNFPFAGSLFHAESAVKWSEVFCSEVILYLFVVSGVVVILVAGKAAAAECRASGWLVKLLPSVIRTVFEEPKFTMDIGHRLPH